MPVTVLFLSFFLFFLKLNLAYCISFSFIFFLGAITTFTTGLSKKLILRLLQNCLPRRATKRRLTVLSLKVKAILKNMLNWFLINFVHTRFVMFASFVLVYTVIHYCRILTSLHPQIAEKLSLYWITEVCNEIVNDFFERGRCQRGSLFHYCNCE